MDIIYNNVVNIFITYVFLIAAVIFGSLSNIYANQALGFSKFIPSLISCIFIIICMFCLSHSMKTIPVGYTYATFAGLCIIVTTILGIIKFNQWPNIYSLFGIILIVIGVLLVNLLGKN